MADTIPQTRQRSSSDAETPQKKIKLDVAIDAAEVAPKSRKKNKQKKKLPEPYSSEDVMWRDVVDLLGSAAIEKAAEEGHDWHSPFGYGEEVQVQITNIAPTGEGIGIAPAPKPPWVVVVPFCLPGEMVKARVYRGSRMHSFADLVSVESQNPELRDDSRIKCKYFGSCAGCQYQPLSYETQLELKRTVIVKAYKNFSDLPESSIPIIGSTFPSPLQYGYRTKITPHFDAPPVKVQKSGIFPTNSEKPDWLRIGFNQIGRRYAMDIEECPIATPVINEALEPLRKNIIQNILTYKKGVSLILRDSIEASDSTSEDNLTASFEKHVCITDHKSVVRERVGDKLFEFKAGAFFQNNNSILLPLTTYVRDAIFPPPSPQATNSNPTHLVDTYCGSGLFAITLSPHFEQVAGIEVDQNAIKAAANNVELNNLPSGKCTFRTGDAADIFSAVGEFPRDRTVTIIDPPRKGSDDKFIDQLMNFGCGTVVYVSCNVHTQARDVGKILRKTVPDGRKYVLESLRGFDLFPQTAHVESVAVLKLSPSS